jgi:cell division protein FtsW
MADRPRGPSRHRRQASNGPAHLATVTALPRLSPERSRTRRARPTGGASTSTLLLAIAIGVLTLTGLVMVLSASAADAQATYGTPWYHFQRQAIWLVAGIAGLTVALRIDLDWIRSAIRWSLFGTLGLLALVLLPFGRTVNGATRWLELGPLTIQPSELAKLVLVLYMADLLARRADEMHDLRRTLVPVLWVFGSMAVLIFMQPNMGTVTLLAAIMLAVLYTAGIPGRYVGVGIGVFAAGFALFAVAAPYRLRRITAFLDPWADQYNAGYQTLQSQAALANGGVFGGGVGQGRSKFGYLPEGHTDFIFSNIGEELGLLGTLLIVGLFALIAVVGLRVARQAPDRFRSLLASGIVAWISIQAVVNLGAAVGLLPITGVPLPLVSAGGSSLVVTLLACGILLNISRSPSSRGTVVTAPGRAGVRRGTHLDRRPAASPRRAAPRPRR